MFDHGAGRRWDGPGMSEGPGGFGGGPGGMGGGAGRRGQGPRAHHGERPGRERGPWMHMPPLGGPLGGPAAGAFGRRGRLARRGDVRIAILALLAEKPMHGYQVIQELEARSGGRWRPSAGSVYPTLQQLEDEGLVHGEEQGGRRIFALTETGRAEVAGRAAEGRSWEWRRDPEDDVAFELRDLSFEVVAAAMQVGRVGSPETTRRAREVLVDARRRLYRLLAEDDATAEPAGTPAGDPTPGRPDPTVGPDAESGPTTQG